jgi:hypothetical protein
LIIGIIGLIGGILAAAGVFLSWAYIEFEFLGMPKSADIPGWDMAKGETTIMGVPVPGPKEPSPYVVLAGGILALVGVFGAVVMRTKKLSILIMMGGLIAILGAIWGFSVIQTGTVTFPDIGPVDSSYGYGLYLCLVGGILALIGGIMGVKAKK